MIKKIEKNNESIMNKVNKIDEKIKQLQDEKDTLLQDKKRNDSYLKEYQKIIDQKNALIDKYENGL